jgi:signal peptidase I
MAGKSLRDRALWLWREWARPFLVALAIILPLRSSIADWYEVPTGSMKPTIIEGDRVFVNKLAYDLKIPFTHIHLAHWADPQRGDIVVFPSPTDGIRLVKRVIGLPGDVLTLSNNQLLVNGTAVNYAPISADQFKELSDTERARCRFYTEHLANKDHTVMIDPVLPSMRSFPAVHVPEGSYFMMGDNRDNSGDSRYFGFVDRSKILGKATDVVVSLDYEKFHLPRMHRFLRHL